MRGRRGVKGLFLIFAGIILLLNNWGIIDWSIWMSYVYLWPLILVIMGIKMLLPQSVFTDLLVVLLLMAIPLAYYYGIGPGWGWEKGMFFHPRPMHSQNFGWERQKQAEVTRGTLDIDFGAGELKMGPAFDRLFRASFSTIAQPKTDFQVVNGEAQISIKSRPESTFNPRWSGKDGNEWDLFLQNDLPWTVTIDSGATNGSFDFSHTRVESLSIDTGASNLVVRLGDNGGESFVYVNAGASDMTVQVPTSAALKIKISSALSGKEFAGLNLSKQGEYYVTPNLGQAKSTINLEINTTVSKLRVETYALAGTGV